MDPQISSGMFKFKVTEDRLMMATDIRDGLQQDASVFSGRRYSDNSKVMINAFRKESTWDQVALGYDRDPNVPIVQDYVYLDIPYEALEALTMCTRQFKPLDLSPQNVKTFTRMPELTPEEREFAKEHGEIPSVSWPPETLEVREAEIATYNEQSEHEKEAWIAMLKRDGVAYREVNYDQTKPHIRDHGHRISEIHSGGIVSLQEAFDNGGVHGEAFRDYMKAHFEDVPATPSM